MSNALTPLSPTFWSKIMGEKLYKKNVFRNIASFKEEAVLSYGLKVDRPYRADVYVQPYVKGEALTAQDITATSDQLTVDKSFGLLIYVDDIDKIQNKWDAASAWSEEAVTRLSNQIDADCLYLATSANDTVDYNDLDSGQTAGLPIVLTTSNVLNLFTVTARKLSVNNVGPNRFFVISPQVKQVLLTYLAGRESILGDRTGEVGNIGRYMGFDLFESNNLTAKIRWTPTDNPSNGETLIINGVTITFETTPATVTSGFAVDIGASTAATLDNVVSMINTPTTDSATVGKPATGSTLASIQRGWVAVDGTTYVDIYIKGGSQIATTTGTAEGTTSRYTQINFAGERGAVDLVLQKNPSVKMATTIAAGKDGMNILPRTLYAAGVFYDMKARIFAVEIDTSVF
jgi:hypothetical protein